jgi:hypothetical protein
LVGSASERQGRVPEVVDRGALAQELGIDRHAEARSVFFPRRPFERRNHDVVRRPRQYRAAHDDDVVLVLVREGRADLLGDALEIRQVQAAVLPAGGADADE